MHISFHRKTLVALVLLGGSLPLASASADTVMQQCGQQYQAAKAGNTLNGATWNQFRVACAARLKSSPAAESAAAPANPLKPTPAAAPAPAAPASAAPASASPAEETPPEPTAAAPATTASAKPLSPGRAAERVRIKACGAEWKANKVTLIAATPGLKWPQYWHTCSTRMKAAGQ